MKLSAAGPSIKRRTCKGLVVVVVVITVMMLMTL